MLTWSHVNIHSFVDCDGRLPNRCSLFSALCTPTTERADWKMPAKYFSCSQCRFYVQHPSCSKASCSRQVFQVLLFVFLYSCTYSVSLAIRSLKMCNACLISLHVITLHHLADSLRGTFALLQQNLVTWAQNQTLSCPNLSCSFSRTCLRWFHHTMCLHLWPRFDCTDSCVHRFF